MGSGAWFKHTNVDIGPARKTFYVGDLFLGWCKAKQRLNDGDDAPPHGNGQCNRTVFNALMDRRAMISFAQFDKDSHLPFSPPPAPSSGVVQDLTCGCRPLFLFLLTSPFTCWCVKTLKTFTGSKDILECRA